MVLLLQVWIIQELWGHGSIYQGSRKSLRPCSRWIIGFLQEALERPLCDSEKKNLSCNGNCRLAEMPGLGGRGAFTEESDKKSWAGSREKLHVPQITDQKRQGFLRVWIPDDTITEPRCQTWACWVCWSCFGTIFPYYVPILSFQNMDAIVCFGVLSRRPVLFCFNVSGAQT